MRRGLTMVELLVSLSLLSAIMLATASWTQLTASASATAADPARWLTSARATLQLIHDDLATGDFDHRVRRRDNRQPRATMVDGVLVIRTRDTTLIGDRPGSTMHRYAFDSSSGELKLDQEAPGASTDGRLLLDHVRNWHCVLDEHLKVTIVSDYGWEVTRSYRVP